MSLEDAIGDLMCQAYPVRGSRDVDKGINEWLWAETAAYVQFDKEFRSRNKGAL
jgi:hypothetical protein